VTDVLDGDIPTETMRKRNGDVSAVGIYFNVEIRTWATPVVGAMLFCAMLALSFLIIEEG